MTIRIRLQVSPLEITHGSEVSVRNVLQLSAHQLYDLPDSLQTFWERSTKCRNPSPRARHLSSKPLLGQNFRGRLRERIPSFNVFCMHRSSSWCTEDWNYEEIHTWFSQYDLFTTHAYGAADQRLYTYFGMTKAPIEVNDRIVLLTMRGRASIDSECRDSHFSAIVLRRSEEGSYRLIGGAVILLYQCINGACDDVLCGFSREGPVEHQLRNDWDIIEVDLD